MVQCSIRLLAVLDTCYHLILIIVLILLTFSPRVLRPLTLTDFHGLARCSLKLSIVLIQSCLQNGLPW